MKATWRKLEVRIDALSLRERAMAFAIGALLIAVLVNTFAINPQFERQRQLSQQIKLDQQQIAAMQAEIQLRVSSHDADPDASVRARLEQLQQQSVQTRQALAGMQTALVSPDKMASLLEDILRKNGHLRLRSLKTLPVAVLNKQQEAATAMATAPQPEKAVAESVAQSEAVYKHGVEIVVQGSYPDLLRYLAELEALPWQLFWDKVSLDATTYPDNRLTLTLFTLSLDKQWLNM